MTNQKPESGRVLCGKCGAYTATPSEDLNFQSGQPLPTGGQMHPSLEQMIARWEEGFEERWPETERVLRKVFPAQYS